MVSIYLRLGWLVAPFQRPQYAKLLEPTFPIIILCRMVAATFLAHSDKDKIRETYNEATYDKERRQLAQLWSDQLDMMLEGAKVI